MNNINNDIQIEDSNNINNNMNDINTENKSQIKKDNINNNYRYNYQPSKYNSLLDKKELGPDDRKILEKYNNNYDYKSRLTYDYFNNYPCYNNYQSSNKYKYNSLCDYPTRNNYLLNNDYSKPTYLERNNLGIQDYAKDVPSYKKNNYQRPLNFTYTYCLQTSKDKYDYGLKKDYPDNLLQNTKLENYYNPNSTSKYQYQRYFKNESLENDKKNENNIANSNLSNENNININTNINREAENQLSKSESNNINNSNDNNIAEEKPKVKEETYINNNYIPQNIPKSGLYHYNTTSNKNYINNINNNYSQNIKEDMNNNKSEIIINRSPSDYYYNTLHEEYFPKKEEEAPIKNNRIYRTYEIDSSKYDDNQNSLFCHSSIINDLKRKNGYYYC